MSQRCAEQSHDPVAHHLVDGTFVAMHRLDHLLQHRVEQGTGVFGIAVGEQFHRAFQIDKQDGHLLALAFQGFLGQQDALSQVLGGILLGRREARRRWSV